jgi:hypothetical protein
VDGVLAEPLAFADGEKPKRPQRQPGENGKAEQNGLGAG